MSERRWLFCYETYYAGQSSKHTEVVKIHPLILLNRERGGERDFIIHWYKKLDDEEIKIWDEKIMFEEDS